MTLYFENRPYNWVFTQTYRTQFCVVIFYLWLKSILFINLLVKVKDSMLSRLTMLQRRACGQGWVLLWCGGVVMTRVHRRRYRGCRVPLVVGRPHIRRHGSVCTLGCVWHCHSLPTGHSLAAHMVWEWRRSLSSPYSHTSPSHESPERQSLKTRRGRTFRGKNGEE